MSQGNVRVPSLIPDGGGSFSTSTTSARSTADHPAGSNHVWVWADVASWINIGDDTVTASNNDMPLPANVPVFLRIAQGQRIAAITFTGTGNLYYSATTY